MSSMQVWSWRQAILRSTLESSTKLVLLALSTYMNDHGEGCYPSQEQVALDTSLSKRSVITHIDLAVGAGFLAKDKRKLPGRKWDANEYRASIPSDFASVAPHDEGVNVLHPMTEKPARGEMVAPHETAEGCNGFLHGVNQLHTNSPENSPLIKKEGGPPLQKKRAGYSDEFEAFWKTYPPNTGSKADAARAYEKAIKQGVDHATVRNSAANYGAYLLASGITVAHAATWLNGERWTIDYSSHARREIAAAGNRPAAGGIYGAVARDSRDPAARASDEGERIIAARRAARDDVAGRSGRAGPTDAPALPDLRQPGDVRGQGADDGISRPNVPAGAGGVQHRPDPGSVSGAYPDESGTADPALHSQADRPVFGASERGDVRPN